MNIEELRVNFYVILGGYLALMDADKLRIDPEEFLKGMEELFKEREKGGVNGK